MAAYPKVPFGDEVSLQLSVLVHHTQLLQLVAAALVVEDKPTLQEQQNEQHINSIYPSHSSSCPGSAQTAFCSGKQKGLRVQEWLPSFLS